MAWTAAALDANIVSATAADTPLFLAHNILWDPVSTPLWTSADTFAAGSQTDVTDVDYPAMNAVSNHTYRGTRARPSGVNTYYYLIQADVGSVFDTIALRINWVAEGTTSITVKRADNITGTNQATLATQAGFTPPARILKLSLGTGNQQFSGTGFIQVAVTSSATTICPELGGLYVGQRRVLNRQFECPFDDDPLEIDAADFLARGAARQRMVRDGPVAMFRGKYSAKTGGRFSQDDIDTLRTIYSDCEFGTRPVVFAQAPTTAVGSVPHKFWYGYIPPQLQAQRIAPDAYVFDFEFDETRPYREPEAID